MKREMDYYLRMNKMPHILCPGCGHGIAMQSLLRAIDKLELDDVFHTWYYHAPREIRDVGKLKNVAFERYELEFIDRWAGERTNTDIVIEGGWLRDRYNVRDKVIDILRNRGWENIVEVGLQPRWTG